jgi:subtilisin family serine protease
MRPLLPPALLLIAACLLPLSRGAAGHGIAPAGVDPQQAGAPLNLIVFMDTQVQPGLLRLPDGPDGHARLETSLRQAADASQASLRRQLAAWQAQGRLLSFTPLWIVNAVAVTARADLLPELAQQPGVARLELDAEFPPPFAPAAPRLALASTLTAAAAANIALVHAPELWELGFAGQGVVIASLDTGVDLSHPELRGRWRGGKGSWYDPYGQHPAGPVDLNGHGTWTMGVMLGGSASGQTIGMAPQATWIAARIFADDGLARLSAVHQAFQWVLDPDGDVTTSDAPQLVNNSWTFNSLDCNREFAPDLQALLAAHITPVFAAGNYGPLAPSAPGPANNPGALAVGDTDGGDRLDPASSRGPNPCSDAPSPYPQLVAPGVAVSTTDLHGGYLAVSGTSFSAPHVTGALALLLSAYPGLAVSSQRRALLSAALDLGDPGPDDQFGAGRLDVLAAYHALASGAVPTDTPTPTPTPTDTPTSTPRLADTATPTATATPTGVSTPTPTETPPPVGSLPGPVVYLPLAQKH